MRRWCALFLFAASLSLRAQVVELKARGGGALKIGATSYQFALDEVWVAPAKGGLPGAVKLVGSLVPDSGGPGFRMTLSVLKTGALYMLTIERRNGRAYPDSWAATVKTKTKALRMEAQPGGRIEIQCEGPLTGVIAQRPAHAAWSGTLWAEFPGGNLAPGNPPGN